MAKKVTPPPAKTRRGPIVVRNVNLDVFDEFKKVCDEQEPQLKYGPGVTQALREWVERRKR
jgi:hypothetical protein